MSIVTLITDFGTRDGYVGEMKGVILSACSSARIVDVTHDIEPGDVAGAAWVLGRIWERFPPDTVHLVVVDPGVGSDRVALAARVADRWFVGPDNGVLSTGMEGPVDDARRIDPAGMGLPAPSTTFHGRDVFAPAAGWLAAGHPSDGLGPPVDPAQLRRFSAPVPTRVGDAARGEVVRVDRFGNLITNIPASWVNPTALVEVGGQVISGLRTHYAMVEPGDLVALIGSGGTLEISVRNESAAARLDARRGARVSVRAHRD